MSVIHDIETLRRNLEVIEDYEAMTIRISEDSRFDLGKRQTARTAANMWRQLHSNTTERIRELQAQLTATVYEVPEDPALATICEGCE